VVKKLVVALVAALCVNTAVAAQYVPMVSGAINPDVTQENIHTTICVPGFTKTIRPKPYYTDKLKLKQIKQFGLVGTKKDFEEDHLISLELGGHPSDPNNLWPEPWTGDYNAHIKDRLENVLHDMVCSGEISLAQAQHEIASDWVGAYNKYVKKGKK
jgi:hypothetical protein